MVARTCSSYLRNIRKIRSPCPVNVFSLPLPQERKRLCSPMRSLPLARRPPPSSWRPCRGRRRRCCPWRSTSGGLRGRSTLRSRRRGRAASSASFAGTPGPEKTAISAIRSPLSIIINKTRATRRHGNVRERFTQPLPIPQGPYLLYSRRRSRTNQLRLRGPRKT